MIDHIRMDKLLFSVIIPAYNVEKYISSAIGSVISQTYKNIEIIVVDDGSTDNTKDILKEYIKENKIKYIYQKNNGPASARNSGIKNSSGEFIAFLDADDVWLQDKLEKQLKLFNDQEVALVYSDMEFFGGKFRFHYHKEMAGKFYRGRVYDKLLLNNFIPTSSIVIKKSILNDVGFFDEDKKLFAIEDYDLWLRIARKYKVDFIDEPLVKYRVHNNQISKPRKESYKGLCNVYKKELRRAPFLLKLFVLLKYLENLVKYFIV